MAVVERAVLMERIKSLIGDSTDDESISLVEDVNDTFSDMERRISESGDWETKYKENDAGWRRKYRDRFFEGDNDDRLPETPADTEERSLTYESLFS